MAEKPGASADADGIQEFVLYLDTLFESLHVRLRETVLFQRCARLHCRAPSSFRETVDKATAELVSVINGPDLQMQFAQDAGTEKVHGARSVGANVIPVDSVTCPKVSNPCVPNLLLPRQDSWTKQETERDLVERYYQLLLSRLNNNALDVETRHRPSPSSYISNSRRDDGNSCPTQSNGSVSTQPCCAPTMETSQPKKRRWTRASGLNTRSQALQTVRPGDAFEEERSEKSEKSKKSENGPSPSQKHACNIRGKSFNVDLDAEDQNRRNSAYEVDQQVKIAKSDDEGQQRWCMVRLRQMVASFAFEVFFATWIVLSAMVMGVEVEYTLRDSEHSSHYIFYAFRLLFSALFTLELVCRFLASGFRDFFCSSQWAWNLFDAFIVGGCLVESAMDIFDLAGDTETSRDGGYSGMRSIRIVRISRVVRIVRITRVLRFVRALRTMIHSIVSTLKTLLWAMILLILLLYIFAVVFTQTVIDHTHRIETNPSMRDRLQRYFGSLSRSMLTLFKVLTGGIDWDLISDALGHLGALWEASFIIFIAFGVFVFLNVVTGVFCQTAIDAAQHDQELILQTQYANKQMYTKRIRQLFKKLDDDDSGVITVTELHKAFDDIKVKEYFRSLDIDTDDAWSLFKLLDTDETNIIDLDEFILGCLRLKGAARSIDIAKLMYEHKWMMKRFVAFTAACEETLNAEGRNFKRLISPQSERSLGMR